MVLGSFLGVVALGSRVVLSLNIDSPSFLAKSITSTFANQFLGTHNTSLNISATAVLVDISDCIHGKLKESQISGRVVICPNAQATFSIRNEELRGFCLEGLGALAIVRLADVVTLPG